MGAKPGGKGTSGRDDRREAKAADKAQEPARRGGDPRRMSRREGRTNSRVRQSVCRESAARSGCDVCEGVPCAHTPTSRTNGGGMCSPGTPARSILPVRRERLSRLCVLMNPNLPGAIRLDLAGYIIELAVFAGRTVPGWRKHKTYIPAFYPAGQQRLS